MCPLISSLYSDKNVFKISFSKSLENMLNITIQVDSDG